MGNENSPEEKSNLQVLVPVWLHRQLKADAALKGISLAEYLTPDLERIARRQKQVPK